MLELARDPIFYLGDIHDLTKDQLRERTFEKIGSLVHHVTNESIEDVSSILLRDFSSRQAYLPILDPRSSKNEWKSLVSVIQVSGPDLVSTTVFSSEPSDQVPHQIKCPTGWNAVSSAVKECSAVSV